MKQYCRYCCNACLNDDELAYCSYKDEMLDGPALRRLNHCKGFRFCEIDVLTQTRTYQPRVAKPPAPSPEDFGQQTRCGGKSGSRRRAANVRAAPMQFHPP